MARRQLIPATPLRGAAAAGEDPDEVVALDSLLKLSRNIDKLEYSGRTKKQKLKHWVSLVEGVVRFHPVHGYRDIFTTAEPIIPDYNAVTMCWLQQLLGEDTAALIEEFSAAGDGRRAFLSLKGLCLTDVSELGTLEDQILKFRFTTRDPEAHITELKCLHRELKVMQPGLNDHKVVSDYKRALPHGLQTAVLRVQDPDEILDIFREFCAITGSEGGQSVANAINGARTPVQNGQYVHDCWFCGKTGHKNDACPDKKTFQEMAAREAEKMAEHRARRANGPGTNGGRGRGGAQAAAVVAVPETATSAQATAVAGAAHPAVTLLPTAAAVTSAYRTVLRNGETVDIPC